MNKQPTMTVRKAEMSDLSTIKKIADSHKQELGFVLEPILAKSIALGELLIAENGEGVVGFVQYHHRRDSQTTLHNIVVQAPYRNKGVGHQLVEALESEARLRDQNVVKLKCPQDISANSFYEHIGYERVEVERGKKRQLHVWQKML
jgi:N-acetylglutamate synthase-like GNAT family acetyltransferase